MVEFLFARCDGRSRRKAIAFKVEVSSSVLLIKLTPNAGGMLDRVAFRGAAEMHSACGKRHLAVAGTDSFPRSGRRKCASTG